MVRLCVDLPGIEDFFYWVDVELRIIDGDVADQLAFAEPKGITRVYKHARWWYGQGRGPRGNTESICAVEYRLSFRRDCSADA